MTPVLRCPHCRLNQFRTESGICRRCRKPYSEVVRISAELPESVKPNSSCVQFPDALRLVLLALRHGLGWSQTDVARRMGVPRTHISRWEHDRDLTIDSLVRYASAFSISPQVLLAIAADLRERAA